MNKLIVVSGVNGVIDVTDLNSEEMTNYIEGLRNENIN